MKRFILVLMVVIFLPATTAHSQMTVAIAAVVDPIMTKLHLDQIAFYVQQAIDMGKEIEHFETQIKQLARQIDMNVQNLQNIKNIQNWDDFMDWYNRQLYLERRTEETWNNMNVSIGKKNYKLTDVEGIAYGLQDTYIDYWNKEFTEEQRREMWTNLGLTPANYAYIQTWKEREQQIAREFLSARAIHVEEYQQNMERNNATKHILDQEKDKKDEDPDKLGLKGVAVLDAETNIASNKVLNDIHGDLVDIKEKMAVDMYQNRTPVDRPPMAKWDKDDGIQPLK